MGYYLKGLCHNCLVFTLGDTNYALCKIMVAHADCQWCDSTLSGRIIVKFKRRKKQCNYK